MKTAEEILLEELNAYQENLLETVPKFKEWVLESMRKYAEQAIEECAKQSKAYNTVTRFYSDAAVYKSSILNVINQLK